MNAADYGWLVLLTPLLGLGFNIAVGPSVSRRFVAWGASLSILAGFVFSLLAFVDLLGRDDSRRAIVSTGWHWLSGGSFQVDASILVDPLSSVMLLVITGIGFLIHAYSVGYMDGDGEERRFFAYLNLFVFSMLLLVLAGNFVFLLAGWGLVGLSSYLLIGFWWQRPSAVAAAKKAFVMNAIGDIGLTLGIFVIWNHLHTVDYTSAFAHAPGSIGSGSSTANWIALLLLVGAVAKSAQLPLHTWLPDAMEGPTPVSALIHAATMVTAGVYLVARMWPLYSLAPDISDLVAIIGVATLTVAGLIALVQTDIKRVIA
ncbi:MAG: NADH-quinone oxidoreductase subunit, partial [Gaiellales bacterium]|nr:NADH-quinone oxidoreductase subunit [Gaiellales bacterium]